MSSSLSYGRRPHPSAIPSHDHSDLTTRRMAFALLLLAVAVTFIPWLGFTPFYTKGESREAVVALSMLQTGNWILPLSNGDVIPYKPPFLAWCIALLSLPVGHVTEFTARLPSALALIVMVMVSYRFWARRLGAGTSMVGAVVLFTSFEVYRAGMACRVDMLLTMFMVTAIYSLYRWAMERSCRRVPWGAVWLMAGAVLTKGPVGVVLPCLVAWVTVALCGSRLWRCTWMLLLAALLALVIPGLWYLAAWERQGAEFITLVMEENVGRMAGTMSYDSHLNPWWYNILTLLGGMAPYTLLLLAALLAMLVPGVRHAAGHALRRWRSAAPVRLFLYIAPLMVLLFYCFPASKRSVYLLPMYPFLAVQVALLALWLARNAGGAVKTFTALMALAGMTAFTAWCLLHSPAFMGRFTPGLSLRTMQALEGFMAPAPAWTYIFTGCAALGATVIFVRQFRDEGVSTVIGLCVSVTLLYWCFGAVYQPAAVTPLSDRPLARALSAEQPAGTLYAHVSTPMLRYFTANFYMGDRIEPFDLETAPQAGLVIVGHKDAPAFIEGLRGKATLTPLRSWSRRSCDTRQNVILYRFAIPGTPEPQSPNI